MHQIHLSIFVGFNLWLICHDLYKYREVFSGLWPRCRFKIQWEQYRHTRKPSQLSTIRSEAASHHWQCKSNVQGSDHHLLFI